jgi:hypothetical protein
LPIPWRLGKLIERYRNEPTSSFRELSYEVRVRHERLLARITREEGHWRIRNIHGRTILRWHTDWSADGKNAMASALVWRLRVVFRFGASVLNDVECKRLSELLSVMRFPRSSTTAGEGITAEQATAIRAKAPEVGLYSIAFAQALHFELGLSQKDIIGEWVPIDEPGEAELSSRGKKWRRGLLWSNVDGDLTLRHSIGWGRQSVEFDLKRAPMVMEELQYALAQHRALGRSSCLKPAETRGHQLSFEGSGACLQTWQGYRSARRTLSLSNQRTYWPIAAAWGGL